MYWKVTTLRMMLRVPSGRSAVSRCMWPPRHGECSGASHWPMGCDSVTGRRRVWVCGYHVRWVSCWRACGGGWQHAKGLWAVRLATTASASSTVLPEQGQKVPSGMQCLSLCRPNQTLVPYHQEIFRAPIEEVNLESSSDSLTRKCHFAKSSETVLG